MLISPIAFIFAYSYDLLVYSGFVGVFLRWCIAPRSEVPMLHISNRFIYTFLRFLYFFSIFLHQRSVAEFGV